MYVSVNIWFLCFVIAAVCCCIHVCVCTGKISQRKRRRRPKTTELKQFFSNNYLNSPGGFKVRPGTPPFIPLKSGRIEMSRIAFYVQRARLKPFTHLCDSYGRPLDTQRNKQISLGGFLTSARSHSSAVATVCVMPPEATFSGVATKV